MWNSLYELKNDLKELSIIFAEKVKELNELYKTDFSIKKKYGSSFTIVNNKTKEEKDLYFNYSFENKTIVITKHEEDIETEIDSLCFSELNKKLTEKQFTTIYRRGFYNTESINELHELKVIDKNKFIPSSIKISIELLHTYMDFLKNKGVDTLVYFSSNILYDLFDGESIDESIKIDNKLCVTYSGPKSKKVYNVIKEVFSENRSWTSEGTKKTPKKSFLSFHRFDYNNNISDRMSSCFHLNSIYFKPFSYKNNYHVSFSFLPDYLYGNDVDNENFHTFIFKNVKNVKELKEFFIELENIKKDFEENKKLFIDKFFKLKGYNFDKEVNISESGNFKLNDFEFSFERQLSPYGDGIVITLFGYNKHYLTNEDDALDYLSKQYDKHIPLLKIHKKIENKFLELDSKYNKKDTENNLNSSFRNLSSRNKVSIFDKNIVIEFSLNNRYEEDISIEFNASNGYSLKKEGKIKETLFTEPHNFNSLIDEILLKIDSDIKKNRLSEAINQKK